MASDIRSNTLSKSLLADLLAKKDLRLDAMFGIRKTGNIDKITGWIYQMLTGSWLFLYDQRYLEENNIQKEQI